MVIWLAGAIGLLLGALFFGGYSGGLAGAALGLILGLAMRSREQGARASSPSPVPASFSAEEATRAGLKTDRRTALAGQATPRSMVGHDGAPTASVDGDTIRAILQRMSAIERRLAGIEARLRPLGEAVQRGAEESLPRRAAAVPAVSEGGAAATEPSLVAPRAASSAPEPPRAESPSAPAAPRRPFRSSALWSWVVSGNTLTRVGVVVLFFGVGFLLKSFAEHFTISLEWRLLAVALAGGILVALGAWLARARPAYGLSLQGLGAGILYLTTFAALRLYAVLPAAPAFALLVGIAALTVALAMRASSQSLAALAIAGGFLAPFLVTDAPGAPALLFGYFAILNAAIFALAWRHTWRALNVLGFVFTFALGGFWGHRYYSAQYLTVVEPYLVLFFLFYVTIAVLYAKRAPLAAKAPVDALLVFGVPLVGFALQTALIRDVRYGIAISAFAIAALYGGSFIALRRRSEPGLALLSRTFLFLGIIFATIAIPFAVDARWTSAWWALEAAALYWIGGRQRQPLARTCALLLQVGAGIAFVLSGVPSGERLFANASFLGTTLIALAGLLTAYIADTEREQASSSETNIVPLIFAWGVAWWIGGGMFELHRQLPRLIEDSAMLAWVTASVMLALATRGWLRWSRLAWFGAALLPAMALVAMLALHDARTTLLAYGWLLWPLAWVTQWRVLRTVDTPPADTTLAPRGHPFLANAHTASAITLVMWSAWEASEWAGRFTPGGTVWIACAAALPAIVYLAWVLRYGGRVRWPFPAYRDAYAVSAGTIVAALLSVWFVRANFLSPGDPAPLAYLPLSNPLDVTLLAVLVVLFFWARRYARIEKRLLYGWLAAGLFLLVNAIVLRTVHQWSGVPWHSSALFASRALQAALTLTWTLTALPLMLVAARHRVRPLWILGASLLAVVVGKLFLIDLAALSGAPRIAAFLGVGVSLLVIGYAAPLPPAADQKS